MSATYQPYHSGKAGYVDVGDLRVYYEEIGAGEPLVLIHGGLATATTMWAGRIDELAHYYHVYAPDSRGHGRTNNPAGRLSYSQMADDVAGFIDALVLDRPLVLGYSDGAQVGLELGLRHPDHARALVLGGVITRPTETYMANLNAMGFADPAHVDLDRIGRDAEFLESIRADHQHVYGPDYWRTFLPQIAALWAGVPYYSDEQLAGIENPTLVICGDRDEGDSLPESLRLYGLLPNGELAVVPHADHGAAGGDLFWYAVEDFLARHV